MNAVKPKIGLLPTGHKIYWGQFPNLKEMGMGMYNAFKEKLSEIGEVVSSELVDSVEAAEKAAQLFKTEPVDILLIFPLGYTTGMMIVPVVRMVNAPIRLLNAHMDAAYDYANSDTAEYLYHEGPCCIPEYAGTLVSLNKKFRVISGYYGDEALWNEISRDCAGAAAAREFSGMTFGVIGNTYTNMTDMPIVPLYPVSPSPVTSDSLPFFLALMVRLVGLMGLPSLSVSVKRTMA